MRRPVFGSLSIRGKMTLAALTPLLLVLLLVAVAIFYLINAWIVDEAQKRVRRQLHAAREVLRQEERHLLEVVRLAARSPELARGLAALRRGEGLDILTLTDPHGMILRRGANPGRPGGDSAPATLIRVFSSAPRCGTVLLAEEELAREGEELAERARIPLRPPLPTGDPAVETRGLFLVCSTPLTDAGGRLLGYLYGGLLLNNNFPLVDRIKEIIYGGETHRGTEIGSATLFLGDRRVATTIRLQDGSRAVGTRVSTQVAEAVLGERRAWVDRAHVVDQWYLTAYEPILDPGGTVVGALYVGLLERPYALLKTRAALLLLGLLVFGGGLGYLLARTAAKHLSRPLLDLEASAQKVAEGERQVFLPVTTRDEVGRLTETFNRMTVSLREREEELSRLNRQLEQKVEERTALLEEKSLELIRAQEGLARAERLAAIGSLAAGVAHEINNPAAIIRGNVEILLGELPPDGAGREEADEILKQTERISLITQGLLTFAREQELRPERVQVNALLTEILAQAGHQAPLGEVEVRTTLAPGLPELPADRERLRQVFTNLVVNALQAMAGRGTLTVSSRRDGAFVEVAVADTGPGIPSAVREKLFHPFFTTKRNGTGLGLPISYGIVRAMGGSIAVDSAPGCGAIFSVRLRCEREEEQI